MTAYCPSMQGSDPEGTAKVWAGASSTKIALQVSCGSLRAISHQLSMSSAKCHADTCNQHQQPQPASQTALSG